MNDDPFKDVKFVAEVPLEKVLYDKRSFRHVYQRQDFKVYVIPSEIYGFIYIDQQLYWFSYFNFNDDIVYMISMKNFDDILQKIDPAIAGEFVFHLDIFKNSIQTDSMISK